MPRVIDRIVNTIVHVHRPVLLVGIAAALISVGLLIKPGLREDYRIESLVAADDPEYYRYRRFGEQFVSGELALIVMDVGDPLDLENLEMMHWICQQCRRIEGVESPLAISELPQLGLWALFGSMGRLQTVYERLQEAPSSRARIEAELKGNPLVVGNLIGQDPRTGELTRTTGILVQVAGEAGSDVRRRVAEQLRRVVAEASRLRPGATILLGGPLTGLMEIFEAIHRDLVVFSVVVVILICVALLLIMRRVWLLVIALVAAGVSSLCILGLSILCGMAMSLVSQTIMILIVVMSVSMCVHLMVGHEETRLHRDGTAHGPLHDARQTLQRLLVPCFLSALTTVFGFASLMVSALQPIRHLATLGIAGILLALVFGLVVIPALSRFAARSLPVRHDIGRASETLAGIARLGGRARAWQAVVLLAFALVVGSCAVKVPAALRNFEGDFVKNFRENSNIRRVYRFVEQNLGPVGSIEVIVRRKDGRPVIGETAMQAINVSRRRGPTARTPSGEGDELLDLKRHIVRQLTLPLDQVMAGVGLMESVAELQDRIEQGFNPPVRKVFSLVNLVRQASVGQMLGLNQLQLPLFESQFALTMVLIDQKLSRDFLRHFMTSDGQALRINLRATESDDVYRKLDICRRVQALASRILGPEYDVEVTGLYPLYAKITVDLLRNQLRSFGIALLCVSVTMCIGLRSIRLGLVSMIPNLIPMVLCLGVMGWTGIPINMATAMMLSIALGIAVDNTIHYLWRFRRELAIHRDYAVAIARSHQTVGMACLFNSVVIVGGFWVLCLSEFVPTIYFGMLIGLTMIGALVSVIVLLPVLLILVRPVEVAGLQVGRVP